MIYGLVNQEQADGDRIAIANAIMKNDYHTIQQYVSQRIIIHVMSAHTIPNVYCIYCRNRIVASTRRTPEQMTAKQAWHFEHDGSGETPGKCIGYMRIPPEYPHGLGIENPRNHGCYLLLGCEATSLGHPTEWHRTQCKTIQEGRTYCHYGYTVNPSCLEMNDERA